MAAAAALPPLGLDTSGCPSSTAASSAVLTAGLGEDQTGSLTVTQGEGAVLSGTLSGPGSPIAGGWVCVYGDVLFGFEQALLGVAATAADGSFSLAVGAGPSRQLTAVYRSEAGGATSTATATALLQTRVRPSLKLASTTVRNRHSAYFSGRIRGRATTASSSSCRCEGGRVGSSSAATARATAAASRCATASPAPSPRRPT